MSLSTTSLSASRIDRMAWATRSDLAYVGDDVFVALIRGVARLRERLEEEQERQRNEQQVAALAETARSRPRAYAKTRLLRPSAVWYNARKESAEGAAAATQTLVTVGQ